MCPLWRIAWLRWLSNSSLSRTWNPSFWRTPTVIGRGNRHSMLSASRVSAAGNTTWVLSCYGLSGSVQCKWALLYIERWLKAPMELEDGTRVECTCGTLKVVLFIGRKTIKKRMRAKLKAIKVELRKSRSTSRQTGAWVKQMLQGHLNYYAVSGNHPSLWWFCNQVRWLWLMALAQIA